jgi:hypothetical protein
MGTTWSLEVAAVTSPQNSKSNMSECCTRDLRSCDCDCIAEEVVAEVGLTREGVVAAAVIVVAAAVGV